MRQVAFAHIVARDLRFAQELSVDGLQDCRLRWQLSRQMLNISQALILALQMYDKSGFRFHQDRSVSTGQHGIELVSGDIA